MAATFKGGIHPPENKHISEGIEFKNLSIPHLCYIPLQQHIGAPAKPLVEVGDLVKEGQLIGEAAGFVSANVHASVPGKVVEIIEHPSVYDKQTTIVIEAEGEFKSSSNSSKKDWSTIPEQEIIDTIKASGIVGLGGAAFPTSVKLSPPKEKTIDTLIINGAECEPYLTVDDMLMRTFPVEVIEGVRITLKVLGIKKAIIGIEDNKSEAINSLAKALKEMKVDEDIQVKSVKTKYPQGAEKQLIDSLTGRKVPSRGLPMDIGIVVQNSGTVFAIYEAVVLSKPLFERYITVSGEAINNPGNYKVRLGTKISDIIEECGGLKGEPAKVVVGGPMCGMSIHDMDISVVKGTSGILFLSDKEANTGDYSACIRCGRCVTACPVGLLPCDIASAVEFNRDDMLADLSLSDCIMCASCSFSCPSGRPLSHFIKLGQQTLKK